MPFAAFVVMESESERERGRKVSREERKKRLENRFEESL
jgi:hypothetical protein